MPGPGKQIVYLALKEGLYVASKTKLIFFLKSFVTNLAFFEQKHWAKYVQ